VGGTSPLTGVVAVAANPTAKAALALRADGTVWAWGDNTNGQLGNGTSGGNNATPTQVGGFGQITAIALGGQHALALQSNGKIWAWGMNGSGQLGNGTTTNSFTPVKVSNITTATDVAAGGSHSIALLSGGGVQTWGGNASGQLGNGGTTNSDLPVTPTGLPTIAAIAAGNAFTLAVKNTGTGNGPVFAWGDNTKGQLGNGTTGGTNPTPTKIAGLTSVNGLAAGKSSAFALTTTGAVDAWGDNSSGQYGNGTTTSAAAPVVIANLANSQAVASGNGHTVALTADGTLTATGANSLGQLGDGNTTATTSPTLVTSINLGSFQGAHTYGYDPADDLTATPTAATNGSTQTYDPAQQLCWTKPKTVTSPTCSNPPGGVTAYGYDNRGNRTSVTPPGGPTTTLGYDQGNRLVSYGSGATYSYNGDGLRMAKIVNGTNTTETWDLADPTPLLLVEGTISYLYGPGGLPLEQRDGAGNLTWYHHDQLGSTRVLTNNTGTITGTYTYDPYGRQTVHTGTVTTPLGYTGQYTDTETGLIYLRNRYYDPASAQFLTRDPDVANARSAYGYTTNNPLNYTDPSGLGAVPGAGCQPKSCPHGPAVNPLGHPDELPSWFWYAYGGLGLAGGAAGAADFLVGALTGLGAWLSQLGSCPGPGVTEPEQAANALSALGAQPDFENPAAPGEGWEWRGSGEPGSAKGSWYNPSSGESLHPDLSHPGQIGPHYDWTAPDGTTYRVYPDGRVVPK
jgi:RHS repeat-associated protein